MKVKLPSIILTILIAIVSVTASAQGVVTIPSTPSPAASVSQTIGISTISVKYSRPSVKGREIWGALVPYGWNKQPGYGNGKAGPWRAGANENTVIEFSHPAKVQGQIIPAGSYGLFFTIAKDNTGEVILSKDYHSWGSFWYEANNDILRNSIQIRTIPNTELLTYEFVNITKNSAELVLNWEKKQFPVKIEFDVDNIVMDNATKELKGPVGFSWQGYVSAAAYSQQNNINLEQGLSWINNAVAQNKSFATLQVKSNILKQMNKTTEAEAIMKDAMTVATENEVNAYGYQLLGAGSHDKAIEIFIVNTTKFPKSANTWDSLGEAYFTKGDKKNAIASFKKSLTLNPTEGTKANSEKYLKQLGAL